jgi:tRNA(adenine34) deaminase
MMSAQPGRLPSVDLSSDEHFMREALRLALAAFDADEVPVGAVIVRERECESPQIIARAFNQVELLKDATAHAEILAITQAAQAIGDWRLEGTTVFVTKEPCPMCAGAIVLSRIKRLVFGARDERAGAAGSVFNITAGKGLNHTVEVVGGVKETEARELLQSFFRTKRNANPPV